MQGTFLFVANFPLRQDGGKMNTTERLINLENMSRNNAP